MHPIIKLLNKKEKLVVGLMSGTSMDGIDAALVRIKNFGEKTVWELIEFDTYSYPVELKHELLHLATAEVWNADRLCRLNVVVAELFAQAVHRVCEKASLKISELDLIGSHGQTIRHLPTPEKLYDLDIRTTLQIGELSVISNRCGVVTVGDFRPADMALGGEGAPLVPYCDYILLHSKKLNRAALNIGGISNITILPQNCRSNDVIAFDTGPGNMIIDSLMRFFYEQDYDEGGKIAATGTIHSKILNSLIQHPYFAKQPPKSTGREQFGQSFLNQLLAKFAPNLPPADIIATTTEFIAFSIFRAYQFFIQKQVILDELVVSGGGAHNLFLIKALQKYFHPIDVKTSTEFGISIDAKEAICFAILANETIHGNCNNMPKVTNATSPTILGKICW
ncbi:anhydro-N-acetylmuramic acid kinase [candidate division KSB1 bacterium]|nr:anhydro-N-acetylmuramic acid kinase [candidate division KSB1 bacterium]